MRKKDVLSEIQCYCTVTAQCYENHPVCFPVIIDTSSLCNFTSCGIAFFQYFKPLEKDKQNGSTVAINYINNRLLI